MSEFVVFILSHGRANNVRTYGTLQRGNYTGPLYIILDDEDEQIEEYKKRYGEQVIVFDRREAYQNTTIADNLPTRHGIVFARTACFQIAKSLGYRYFLMLDDDYNAFVHRFDGNGIYSSIMSRHLDEVFEALFEFYESTSFASIAIGQGGDYIGGQGNKSLSSICSTRKMMNTWFCDTEREYPMLGRLNEDVNVYTVHQRAGLPFLSVMPFQVCQSVTQAITGGMSEMYLDVGTYVKSFTTIVYAPSCVSIASMGDKFHRIHHQVDWNACAPKIIHEQWR